MQYYTYLHRRNDTNEIFYVGKGTKRRAWSKQMRNRWWHHIANAHGYNVEVCAYWETEKEAYDHEEFLHECFEDLKCKLVNAVKGGGGITGWNHSDETRIKMRGPRKPLSAETRAKISARLKGNTNGIGNRGNTTKGRPKLKGRKKTKN